MMKKITLSFLFAFAVAFTASAQVKVGDNPTTIDDDAMLEVEATDKGLLLPRVELQITNSAAPLGAHVAGMTVYNTNTLNDVTPGYYYNDGTQWVRILDQAGAEAAATALEPWFGTDDDAGATENDESMYHVGSIQVGDGVTDPNSSIHFPTLAGDYRNLVSAQEIVTDYSKQRLTAFNGALVINPDENDRDFFGTHSTIRTEVGSSAPIRIAYGNFSEVDHEGDNDISSLLGFFPIVKNAGAGDIANAAAINLDSRNDVGSTGNITNNSGIRVLARNLGTGNIENNTGIRIATLATNGGTITNDVGVDIATVGGNASDYTNSYGLRIADRQGTGDVYGIYQTGADDDNYFAGNVGIGTTDPSQLLDVNGNIKYGFTNEAGYIFGADGQIHLGHDGGGYYLFSGNGITDDLIRIGSGRLVIESTGQVRFSDYTGTNFDDTPVALLGVSTDGGIVKQTPAAVSAANEPWFGTDDDMGATTNTEDIYHTGRVGIGAVNPNEKLEVAANSTPGVGSMTTGPVIRINNFRDVTNWGAGGPERLGGIEFFTDDNSAGGNSVKAEIRWLNTDNNGFAPNGELGFFTSTRPGALSEAMRIDENGNVGIGRTDPSHPLHMASGAHVTTAGVWTDASDMRLKENIAASNYGLAEVMQLNPVSYTMKSNGAEQIGFIAQEMLNVIPEVVSVGETEEDMMGIGYGQLTAVLARAMQEQQAQIEEKDARIVTLENRVDAQDALIKEMMDRIEKLENE